MDPLDNKLQSALLEKQLRPAPKHNILPMTGKMLCLWFSFLEMHNFSTFYFYLLSRVTLLKTTCTCSIFKVSVNKYNIKVQGTVAFLLCSSTLASIFGREILITSRLSVRTPETVPALSVQDSDTLLSSSLRDNLK